MKDLDDDIKDLQKQGDLLIADNEIKLSGIKLKIEGVEKELSDLNLLRDNDPIDKRQYNARIENKKGELSKYKKEAVKIVKSLEILRNLMTQEVEIKQNNYGNFLSKIIPISNFNLSKKQKLVGTMVVGILLISVLVYIFLFRAKYDNYKVILPKSYSEIRLGMSLEDFNKIYSEKDFSESSNRDGSTDIKILFNKSSDYVFYNVWTLIFNSEGILCNIMGKSSFNGEVEECCSYIQNVITTLQKANCKKGLDWTYTKYPDCISKVEMYGKLKFKGRKKTFTVLLINDLNTRWGDPLSVEQKS